MGKIIISERQYKHIVSFIKENAMLDDKSKAIVNDILGTLNEGDTSGIIAKVKAYAAKGLMTATILSALMASPKLSNAQKAEVKSAATTSQTVSQNTSADSAVNTKKMAEWNEYAKWLKVKGLSGDKRMNNLQFSKQTMDSFKKEHPNMSLSYEDIGSIQRAVMKYREYCMNQFSSGAAKFNPTGGPSDSTAKADSSNFMSWALKTKDDGIVGQYTSQFMFPSAYLKLLNGKKVSVGYADPSTDGPNKLKQLTKKDNTARVSYDINDLKNDKTN